MLRIVWDCLWGGVKLKTRVPLFKSCLLPVSSSGPDALVVVPAAVDELPLPSIELNAHFQKETYKPAYSTELPFLKSGETSQHIVTYRYMHLS